MKYALPIGTIDLPDGWQDKTTYQFLAPETSDGPLHEASPGSADEGGGPKLARTNVSVQPGHIPPGRSLEECLAAQEEDLRKSILGLEDIESSRMAHETLGEALVVSMGFDAAPGCPVRQLQAYFQVGEDSFVCLAMTCDARVEDEERVTFERLFASFRLPE